MKVTLLATLVLALAAWEFWFTPDQQGDRLFKREQFAEAAEVYGDPMRAGVAPEPRTPTRSGWSWASDSR